MVVVVLLSAGLAGCLSTPSPGPVVDDPDRGTQANFRDPVLVGKGGDTEASLAVGANGTVLVCSHGGFTRHALWASTDGGTRFVEQDTGDPDVSGDCDVSVGDDAWYQVYSAVKQDALPGGETLSSLIELRLATSRDQGESWTITSPLQGTTMVHDRAWLAADGATVMIAYVAARPLGINCADLPDADIHGCAAEDAIMVVRSADGGGTWSTPEIAFAGIPEPSGILNGDLVTWDDGRAAGMPLLVLPSADASTGSIVFTRSQDGGATWTSRQVATTTLRSFPSVSIAEDGRLAVAYATGSRERATVSLATSDDEGTTWSGPVTVKENATFDRSLTTTGNLIPAVAVALDRHGNATLAWVEADDRTGNETWTLHAGQVTSEHAVVFSGPVRSPGHGTWSGGYEFLQVSATPSGDALIAYPWNASGCKDSPPDYADLGRNEQCVEVVRVRAVT